MSERKTDRLRIERVEPSAVYAALALVSAAGMAVTAGQKRDF